VQTVLEALKLEKCAESKVGSPFLQSRGISGGEKRRLSVGMNLLSAPRILFMDEPTSGLDSASALSLFDTLQNLALHKGMTVIATIHQPRSDIFDKFNRLMLLSEGYVAYQGNAGSSVLDYFRGFGLECKSGWNSADWLIDVLADPHTTGQEWAVKFNCSVQRPEQKAPQKSAPAAAVVSVCDIRSVRPKHLSTSFWQQYTTLLRRHFLDSTRNPAVLVLQALGYLSAAVFLGLLFGSLHTNARQQRATSYSFAGSIIIVFCFFAVPVYNQGRAVFSREYASGLFRLSAYYLSSLTVQMTLQVPILVTFTAILAWLQNWRHSAFGEFALITVLLQLGLFAMNETIGAFFSNLLVGLAVSALFAIIFLLFNGQSETVGSW